MRVSWTQARHGMCKTANVRKHIFEDAIRSRVIYSTVLTNLARI